VPVPVPVPVPVQVQVQARARVRVRVPGQVRAQVQVQVQVPVPVQVQVRALVRQAARTWRKWCRLRWRHHSPPATPRGRPTGSVSRWAPRPRALSAASGSRGETTPARASRRAAANSSVNSSWRSSFDTGQPAFLIETLRTGRRKELLPRQQPRPGTRQCKKQQFMPSPSADQRVRAAARRG